MITGRLARRALGYRLFPSCASSHSKRHDQMQAIHRYTKRQRKCQKRHEHIPSLFSISGIPHCSQPQAKFPASLFLADKLKERDAEPKENNGEYDQDH
jgi:hypothetical protein